MQHTWLLKNVYHKMISAFQKFSMKGTVNQKFEYNYESTVNLDVKLKILNVKIY